MNNPQSSDELYEQRKVEELEEKEQEYMTDREELERDNQLER